MLESVGAEYVFDTSAGNPVDTGAVVLDPTKRVPATQVPVTATRVDTTKPASKIKHYSDHKH